jgi:hypothetical protein
MADFESQIQQKTDHIESTKKQLERKVKEKELRLINKQE